MPSGSPTVLTGTLERVVYSSEESAWSVVRLAVEGQRDLVTAVGKLLGVQPGESLRLTGVWQKDPKFGRQFKIESFATVQPASLEGIERYLGSGLIPGIGPKMAQRLVARFGLETLEVIESHPERLARVPGIGPKRRAEIRRAWADQRRIRDVMVFLQSHGVSTNLAIKIFKAYGDESLARVQEDPYRLARDIFGVGFASADRIAASIGLASDSPERARAGVLHTLGQAADRGHVHLPRGELVRETATLLGVGEELVQEAVDDLARRREAVVEPIPGTEPAEQAVYSTPLHAAEAELASRLKAFLGFPPRPIKLEVGRAVAWFEKREGLELAAGQREAIRRGLTEKLLIVTGGPGTGKTTLVRGIVEILLRKEQKILLAAPTGRAARRLSEATGCEARTVHRLLEWNPKLRHFDRGYDRPLAADLVILDEASMLDVHLARSVLAAIPDDGRLVLVGDVDQLPSVGPGRVLADLIRAGTLPVVRLTEIFRQAKESLIVTNAHRVNRGEMPVSAGGEEGDFFFIERREPETALGTVLELVSRRIPGRFGFDAIEGIQILTPMNRGPLGTERINSEVKALVNPQGREIVRGGRGFRVGDKVMQIRNDYELEVFNGDLGRVRGIDEEEQELAIAFDERTIRYPFSSLDELMLAYACTIHKSQGSEYPCVVILLHSQHHIMLQRNLLYTALTRARQLAVVVGERRALARAVRHQETRGRNTLLAERLRGEV